ncbi:immunoglobulin superfamily member 1-like isoform X2 [Eublepharis macularius]|nr:immunoglobulin superfamily member 1-like isoform X2 [Eublepharis macularius]
MAGQWVISRAPYLKPSVSMRSSEGVIVGGNITIHCKNEGQQHAEFSLCKLKGSSWDCQDAKKAEQNEVMFTIFNANQSNAGIYKCVYCFKENSYRERCSDYSDEIHIYIRDPRLSKPSIKLRSKEQLASGLNVTIECQGPETALNYSLYKSRVLRTSHLAQPGRDRAEFSFFIEKMEDAADYTCQYNNKEKPFVWSEPSDPVELVPRVPPLTIIWASCAAGLLLVLLLLLFAFVLYRKRRKDSTVKERNQPANMPLEPYNSTDGDGAACEAHHDEVTYAILDQNSLKTERAAVSDRPSESSIYASVTKDRLRKGQ